MGLKVKRHGCDALFLRCVLDQLVPEEAVQVL
jgi:hypothetical protein